MEKQGGSPLAPPWESPVSSRDEEADPGAWTSQCAQAPVQTPILLPGRPWPKLGSRAPGSAQATEGQLGHSSLLGKGLETFWHLQVGRAFPGSLSHLRVLRWGNPKSREVRGAGRISHREMDLLHQGVSLRGLSVLSPEGWNFLIDVIVLVFL